MWHNFSTMTNAKSLTRIYFPGEIAIHGECRLSPAQAHHVARVLRLASGDAVTLFDGAGREYGAVIARMTKSDVTLNVGVAREVDRESPLVVRLAQAMSTAERMDYTVQKAVELGVSCIRPLATERSVVKLGAERAQKRVAHWQAVVIAACAQCGRNRVPPVLPVMDFPGWLASEAREEPGLRILLAPQATIALRDLSPGPRMVTLLAGPEGGLSPQEHADAEAQGFTPVKLGPRVLRTETAALAALAVLQTLWGDF